MSEKIKSLFMKYKEIILYVLFGGFTTVVNIVVCVVLADWLHVHYMLANGAAWAASVFFAYLTNRIWVFESKVKGFKSIVREVVLFVSARVLSGIGDMIILYVCVDVLGLNMLIAKILCNIFVVIFNYIFSKLIIFKQKKK